jgi:glutathione S-transferase
MDADFITPDYGQANWFKEWHQEKLQSAIDRYVDEINRVSGVLEGHLSNRAKEEGQHEPWLVGNHMSFADIAFLVYQEGITYMFTKAEYDPVNFPQVTAWVARMLARESLSSPMVALAASLEERFGPREGK